jgi:hypothetical protein
LTIFLHLSLNWSLTLLAEVLAFLGDNYASRSMSAHRFRSLIRRWMLSCTVGCRITSACTFSFDKKYKDVLVSASPSSIASTLVYVQALRPKPLF